MVKVTPVQDQRGSPVSNAAHLGISEQRDDRVRSRIAEPAVPASSASLSVRR